MMVRKIVFSGMVYVIIPSPYVTDLITNTYEERISQSLDLCSKKTILCTHDVPL